MYLDITDSYFSYYSYYAINKLKFQYDIVNIFPALVKILTIKRHFLKILKEDT